MITIESSMTIGIEWSNRFINEMVDTLTKKTSSNLYVTNDDLRQIAMKSVIGLLSGGFKRGDTVKVTAIAADENTANNDLQLIEELLRGGLS